MSEEEEDYGGIDDEDTLPPPITLDQLKHRILQNHGMAIGDDDPILVQHTMHCIFIENLQEALVQNQRRVEEIVATASDKTGETVKSVLEVLKNETLDSSLKQTLERFGLEAEKIAGIKQSMNRLRTIIIALTVFSWIALSLNFLVLIRS